MSYEHEEGGGGIALQSHLRSHCFLLNLLQVHSPYFSSHATHPSLLIIAHFLLTSREHPEEMNRGMLFLCKLTHSQTHTQAQ